MATNKTTTTKTSGTRRVSLAQIMFLIAGLCLLVKYILQNPISTAGVFQFVGSLIVTIVLVGFYVLFVFGLPGYNGAWKTLAPVVLILAICGQYSLNFGNADVTSAINSIASIVWVVILVSLFVFVFIHKKWLGMIASVTSLVYALLVICRPYCSPPDLALRAPGFGSGSATATGSTRKGNKKSSRPGAFFIN